MRQGPSDIRELAQGGYRFALSLTHDATRAEDLVQDAWTAVLRADGPWTRPYLYKAIRNRFIDLCRRERRAVFESLNERHGDGLADNSQSWNDDVDRSIPNGTLAAALNGLRPEERAVLYLSAVEEYSASRIGELLGWPRGTVLSLMHRGRIKLEKLLQTETGLRT